MRSADHQKGAVILTVAFALLFLLGFMAIALDFGHMFVVKDELQTSMDACALAAAQELDGAGDAITRATNAGVTAGNLNNVNFQSGTWSEKGKIVAANITFKDAAYGSTTDAASARYAQCQHSQGGIQMWLFQAMGAFAGADPAYSSTKSVGALAVATRASGQSTCPVPIGLNPKLCGGTPCLAPNYGFQVGEWATVFSKEAISSGNMGWYDLTSGGNSGAQALADQLGEPGLCGIKRGDTLGSQVTGAKQSLDVVWNYRFGIYKQNDHYPDLNHPDSSGYAYTSTNWKNAVPQNAYAGSPAAFSDPTAQNFKAKRLAFASYADAWTGTKPVDKGDAITGLTMNSYKTLATPGVSVSCPDAAHEHHCYGYNRRIVVVPIINPAATVQDFACMLMLQPMSGPDADVQMEFLGNAGAINSPCTTIGLAGGTAGPLVPVLVQ